MVPDWWNTAASAIVEHAKSLEVVDLSDVVSTSSVKEQLQRVHRKFYDHRGPFLKTGDQRDFVVESSSVMNLCYALLSWLRVNIEVKNNGGNTNC